MKAIVKTKRELGFELCEVVEPQLKKSELKKGTSSFSASSNSSISERKQLEQFLK